jgi:uncharacterized protein
MSVTLTYPGVYIVEVPSGVRTITGVATSITAFIGRARRGPVDDPIRIQSPGDYNRVFGGLWRESTMSYAVQHYFLHGGQDAIIVRVHNGDVNGDRAAINLDTAGDPLVLRASSPGEWGGNLRAIVDHDTRDEDDETLFNLTIQEVDPATGDVVTNERFLNVSVDEDSPRFVQKVLEQSSRLVEVQGDVPADRPEPSPTNAETGEPMPEEADGGDDGADLDDNAVIGDPDQRTGIFALDKADLFNLLSIPPLTPEQDVGADTTLAAAARYCREHRAMLLVDPPADWDDGEDVSAAEAGINELRSAIGSDLAINVAVYFPRLQMADPLRENRTSEFAPSGAIAGIFARTDAQRGVWKAPAGIDASLVGVRKLTYQMDDNANGRLNPLGLNSLRTFPVYGNVVWGARTLAGADRLSSEWKYVPVRRLALFIEESLYRGTQWVVFEPNDEPLWAQIRLNLGAFMQNLFRQGAFQGTSPREAYFVKCDSETTTQNDIDQGIVNILVGFAPLKPAEFVVIRIQQIAGEIET